MLVREISPVEISGKLSASYVILFRCGFLLAYIAGAGLPSKDADIDFSENHYWQFMLMIPAIITLIQTAILFIVYTRETPKFLYQMGAAECSKEALEKVYTDSKKVDEIVKTLGTSMKDASSKEVGWGQLFSRMYMKAVIVVLLMHFFQQMAAGNVFMMYSTSIFNAADASESIALLGTIMAGVAGVIGVSLFTMTVDCKLFFVYYSSAKTKRKSKKRLGKKSDNDRRDFDAGNSTGRNRYLRLHSQFRCTFFCLHILEKKI